MQDRSRKAIIVSIVIFLVFAALATLGIFIHEEWRDDVYFSRIMISAATIVALGYFFSLIAMMANQPANYAKLLSYFGVVPQNGAFSPNDSTKIRSLLAFPSTLSFAFWFVAFPYWKVYGFAWLAIVGLLAISIIAYWKGIASGFWERYHWFLCRALLVMAGLFCLVAPFTKMWENLFAFAQNKATSWAEGLNKPAQKQTSALDDDVQKFLAQKAKEADEQNKKNQEANQAAKKAEDETDDESEDASSKQPALQAPASQPAALVNERKENSGADKPETDDSDAERERLLDAAEKALDADVDLSGPGAQGNVAQPASPKQVPALKRPAQKREWNPKLPSWLTNISSPKQVKIK